MKEPKRGTRPLASVRAVLMGLVLACLLPGAVASVALLFYQYRLERASLDEAALRTAKSLGKTVDGHLAKLQFMALALTGSPELTSADFAGFHHHAREFMRATGLDSNLAVVDASGHMLLNTQRPFGELLPKSTNVVQLRTLFTTGQPLMSPLFKSPISGEPTLAIYVPVPSVGKIAYALRIDLPSRQLDRLLADQRLPPGWTSAIVDGNGTIAARSMAPERYVGTQISPEVSRRLTHTAEGMVEITTPDGEAFYTAFSRSPGTNWSAAVTIPRAGFEQTQLRRAGLLGFTMLAVAGLGVAFAVYSGRRISGSAEAVIQAATALAAGEPVQMPRVKVREGADVAQALIRAADLLKRRDETLSRAIKSLELSDARLRAIFDSATDAILTADESQTIVMANPAAAAIFDQPTDALIGMSLEQLIPARYRGQHASDVRAFGDKRSLPRQMGPMRDVMALRADGKEFPVDAAISQLLVSGQRLYTVILRDTSERRQAELALQRSEQELRQMVEAHDRVQENERKRIARELHDDLQQTLAAIQLNLVAVRDQLAASSAEIPPSLAEVDALASTALVSTRRIVSDLRPLVLEELGLAKALEEMCSRFTRLTCIDTDLDIQGGIDEEREIARAASFCLYRVAQEALNNVAKHAQADTVHIWFERVDAGRFVLRITDDGRGMLDEDHAKEESFGLVGMQERLRAVGGTLRLTSPPGKGTTVEATIPVRSPAA